MRDWNSIFSFYSFDCDRTENHFNSNRSKDISSAVLAKFFECNRCTRHIELKWAKSKFAVCGGYLTRLSWLLAITYLFAPRALLAEQTPSRHRHRIALDRVVKGEAESGGEAQWSGRDRIKSVIGSSHFVDPHLTDWRTKTHTPTQTHVFCIEIITVALNLLITYGSSWLKKTWN